MKSADTSMREYYAARAPIYDEVYLRPERQADLDELRHRIAEWLARRSVLEFACGTGYWTQFIASAASRMTATDAVAEPLAFARLRPGVERVSFVQADAFALPDSLGTFDAAFAGLWISRPLNRGQSDRAASPGWRSEDNPKTNLGIRRGDRPGGNSPWHCREVFRAGSGRA